MIKMEKDNIEASEFTKKWAQEVKKIKKQERFKNLKSKLPKFYDRILHLLAGVALGYLIFGL